MAEVPTSNSSEPGKIAISKIYNLGRFLGNAAGNM